MKLLTAGLVLLSIMFVDVFPSLGDDDGDKANLLKDDPLSAIRQAAVEILVDGRLNGSGWIATQDGTVITAAHVIWKPHQKIEVLSPTIGRFPAKIIATDPAHDLARLQIQAPDKKFPIIQIADQQPPEGSDVLLYGSALFRHWITIKGSMARRDKSYEYLSDLNLYCGFSIIAAPSPKGTSGGCWIDAKTGLVIGNQSGFINDKANNPSGLAILAPVDAIRAILSQLGDKEEATLGCGFEETFSQSPGFLKRIPNGASGVFTVPIRKGSSAEKAGLTSETLITHINGIPIVYRRELMEVLRKVKPGTAVDLRVLSPENHVPRDLKVTTEIVRRSSVSN